MLSKLKGEDSEILKEAVEAAVEEMKAEEPAKTDEASDSRPEDAELTKLDTTAATSNQESFLSPETTPADQEPEKDKKSANKNERAAKHFK